MTLFPKAVQKFISTYEIAGFIPLDKTLHFVIGATITIFLRKKGIRIRWVFLILIMLETIKEAHDYFVLNSSLVEQTMDVVSTLIYPIVLLIVIKVKAHLRAKIEKAEFEEEMNRKL